MKCIAIILSICLLALIAAKKDTSQGYPYAVPPYGLPYSSLPYPYRS